LPMVSEESRQKEVILGIVYGQRCWVKNSTLNTKLIVVDIRKNKLWTRNPCCLYPKLLNPGQNWTLKLFGIPESNDPTGIQWRPNCLVSWTEVPPFILPSLPSSFFLPHHLRPPQLLLIPHRAIP
jgi:hypothetical protein